MPDYFDPAMLRFKSILGGPMDSQVPPRPMDEVPRPNLPFSDTPPDISQVNIGGANSSADQALDDYARYTPSHEIADKFNEIWSQMPQHEKPSVLRRIVASMAGAGGIKAADAVLNDPYNEARTEWMDKLKMLQPLLGEERAGNVNERMLATNAASQKTANRRADIAQGQLDRQVKADADKREIESRKLQLAQYKAEHPNDEFIKDQATGKVYAVNPQNPTQKVDTGLTFDNFSELEKAQWRIKEAATPRTITTSGTTTTTTTAPSKSQIIKEELPTQTKVRYYNNAKKAIAEHPEYEKYISFGVSGTGEEGTQTVSVSMPGITHPLDWKNSSVDEYKQAVKAVYGDDVDTATPKNTTAAPTTKTTTTTRNSTSTSARGASANPATSKTVPNIENPPNAPKKGSPVGGVITRVRDKVSGQTGAFKGTPAEAIAAGFEVIQ